jgi:hypothetical protein
LKEYLKKLCIRIATHQLGDNANAQQIYHVANCHYRKASRIILFICGNAVFAATLKAAIFGLDTLCILLEAGFERQIDNEPDQFHAGRP